MEKLKIEKNYKISEGYYVCETKEYELTDLVPCSLIPNGQSIVSFQANYIINGTNI
jgi:hypothetical protein